MMDPRVVRLADLLVNYCVSVGPGNQVALLADIAALPLVQETYRSILRAGGHPIVRLSDASLSEIFLKEANDEQLSFISQGDKHLFETVDCRIWIRGATNTRVLSNVDPQRQRKQASAHKELMDIFMRRTASGEMRRVSTLFPTEAQAQEADMSLSDYEHFVYGACLVDRDDPAAAWRAVSRRQQVIVDALKGAKKVVVRGPNIDLELSVEGRTFINSDGRANMPSGEIFTGPVEDSANGWVRFTYPAIYSGREVTGVQLVFKDGKVVEASAEKNASFLLTMLDSDPNARFLGEFAIGTNEGIQRFTKSILFDEKIGGTIHMALGSGYPQTGSKNKSSIHWDMICDMRDGGKIWVDDVLFYESGKFTIAGS